MTELKRSKSIYFSTLVVASLVASGLSALALTGCGGAIQAPPAPLAKQHIEPTPVLDPQPTATFITPNKPVKPPSDSAVDDVKERSEQFATMMDAWMKKQASGQLASDRTSPTTPTPMPVAPVEQKSPVNTELATNQPINNPSEPSVESKPEQATIAERTTVKIEKKEAPPEPTIRLPDPPVDPFAVLDDRMSRRVHADPRDIDAQLDLQLLRYLREQPIPSTNELAALPNEDRELLTALLDGLANFKSTIARSDSPLAVEKARPWLEAAERIRSRSDLAILSASLCTSVRAYGNYDPIDPLRFSAASPRPMVFYCEVDGFLSQLDKDQRWETKLSMELRLFTESGLEVWHDKTESVEDHSRRRRRDFFINKRIQFPANLAPGLYLLKSTVQDLVANRVSETTISIELVPNTATSK